MAHPALHDAEERGAVEEARRRGFHAAFLRPVCCAAGLGRDFVLAVVQHIAEEHDVRLVGEALRLKLRSLIDGVHSRQGEVHDLPSLAAPPGEVALQALWVGVLELDAGTPRERVAEGDNPPHSWRLGHGALEVAVACAVLRPHGSAVRVDRRVARGTRLAETKRANRGLRHSKEKRDAPDEKDQLSPPPWDRHG